MNDPILRASRRSPYARMCGRGWRALALGIQGTRRYDIRVATRLVMGIFFYCVK